MGTPGGVEARAVPSDRADLKSDPSLSRAELWPDSKPLVEPPVMITALGMGSSAAKGTASRSPTVSAS
jgi:hypothetical protein